MKYFKVLKGGKSCNGGTGEWDVPTNGKPGEWMPKINDIIPCQRGYHLCRAENLVVWLNEEIYEAEGRGKFIRHDENKYIFPEAKLLRKLGTWNEKSARLFAADCAEHVLHFFAREYPNDDRPRKAIFAVRDFAMGKITDVELAAARAAARAAWEAAREAAGAAAWEAERKWQTKKIMEYLYPKEN